MKVIGAFLKDQGGDFSKFKVTLFGMGDFFMIDATSYDRSDTKF